MMTDRYSKQTRTVVVAKISTPPVAVVVPDNLKIPYSIPDTIMTGNSPQFVSNFWCIVCTDLRHVDYDYKVPPTVRQSNGKGLQNAGSMSSTLY